MRGHRGNASNASPDPLPDYCVSQSRIRTSTPPSGATSFLNCLKVISAGNLPPPEGTDVVTFDPLQRQTDSVDIVGYRTWTFGKEVAVELRGRLNGKGALGPVGDAVDAAKIACQIRGKGSRDLTREEGWEMVGVPATEPSGDCMPDPHLPA